MKNQLYLLRAEQATKENTDSYRRILVGFALPKKEKTAEGKRPRISACKACLLLKQ